MAYMVKRADRAASTVEVGETLYRYSGWDYGCSNDDTRLLGVRHIAVTKAADGSGPFLTIPLEDLTEQVES